MFQFANTRGYFHGTTETWVGNPVVVSPPAPEHDAIHATSGSPWSTRAGLTGLSKSPPWNIWGAIFGYLSKSPIYIYIYMYICDCICIELEMAIVKWRYQPWYPMHPLNFWISGRPSGTVPRSTEVPSLGCFNPCSRPPFGYPLVMTNIAMENPPIL